VTAAMTVGAVPLLDLKAQYASIRDEINAAMQRVVESQQFILGPEVKSLETEIATYLGCQFGVGVSSGTDALLLALMVIGIQPGDEVITTAYTFFATAGAIARLGAIPVFVDIDTQTYNIDPEQIETRINSRTRAIIPVHLYGQSAELKPIMVLAQRYNLVVIEDAAQAIGAEYVGQRAGTIGHMGCLSFFPSKNLGGFGDGGMVVTNDSALDEKLRLYRNHGYKPKYYNAVVGGNFRLDALQAAVLRVKLNYLDRWTAARRQHAAFYRQLFAEAALQDRIVLPHEGPGQRHVYNQFVIRCAERDDLRQFLSQQQIDTEIYYPQPMHLQECFADLGYHPGHLPRSEAAALETLALPIYPELTPEMQARVVSCIADFYRKWSS
jgi:dTDP-4-amino-4,6-dideoxygalactose transaminase